MEKSWDVLPWRMLSETHAGNLQHRQMWGQWASDWQGGRGCSCVGGAGKVGYLQPQRKSAEPAAWREAEGEARVRPCSALHFHL